METVKSEAVEFRAKRNEYRRNLRLTNPEAHEKVKEASRRFYHKNAEKLNKRVRVRDTYPIWKKHLERTYGISENEYLALLNSQNGVCALCKQTEKQGKRLSVDHSHITNRVRGLLCHPCNAAIGLLKEDLKTIEAIKSYLTTA